MKYEFLRHVQKSSQKMFLKPNISLVSECSVGTNCNWICFCVCIWVCTLFNKYTSQISTKLWCVRLLAKSVCWLLMPTSTFSQIITINNIYNITNVWHLLSQVKTQLIIDNKIIIDNKTPLCGLIWQIFPKFLHPSCSSRSSCTWRPSRSSRTWRPLRPWCPWHQWRPSLLYTMHVVSDVCQYPNNDKFFSHLLTFNFLFFSFKIELSKKKKYVSLFPKKTGLKQSPLRNYIKYLTKFDLIW